jgi:hypothetical protein
MDGFEFAMSVTSEDPCVVPVIEPVVGLAYIGVPKKTGPV